MPRDEPMGGADAMTRAMCIEIHDVAPATWSRCARLLDAVDEAGGAPVTLLVVPDFHGRGCADADPAFVAAVDARLARGDEVALHGFAHRDDGPRPRSLPDWFRRRVRTLSEGEFAALPLDRARNLLIAGLETMHRVGWPVTGFVPPAWLLGPEALAALRGPEGAELAYVALRDRLLHLPGLCSQPTLTLSYAAFTAPRRWLSRPVLDLLARTAMRHAVVRLALHPVDADHPAVLAHWKALIARLLATHAPRTVASCVALQAITPGFDSTVAAGPAPVSESLHLS